MKSLSATNVYSRVDPCGQPPRAALNLAGAVWPTHLIHPKHYRAISSLSTQNTERPPILTLLPHPKSRTYHGPPAPTVYRSRPQIIFTHLLTFLKSTGMLNTDKIKYTDPR